MQELEKIIEEINETIERYGKNPYITDDITDFCYGMNVAKGIIRRHMKNDGWIPVEEELPPNARHMGTLCPRYQLSTKYGVTEGWYNPDLESWFVLIWFLTEAYANEGIDFERGTCPKIVRCKNLVNDTWNIVTAWRPLPEPYKPERSSDDLE